MALAIRVTPSGERGTKSAPGTPMTTSPTERARATAGPSSGTSVVIRAPNVARCSSRGSRERCGPEWFSTWST